MLQFCSKLCRREFKRRLKRSPVNILGERPAFAEVRYERREDIVRCTHCRSRDLSDIQVGRQCFQCGKIMYAKAGDWVRESAGLF